MLKEFDTPQDECVCPKLQACVLVWVCSEPSAHAKSSGLFGAEPTERAGIQCSCLELQALTPELWAVG